MFVLVDWSWVVYREFYANQNMSVNKSGLVIKTGAIRGAFRLLVGIHEAHPEAMIYLCLDGVPTRALSIMPNYKGQREYAFENITVSRNRLARVLTHLPFVKLAYSNKQEADDTIAFLCHMLPRESGEKIVVLSSDMDLRQLVSNENHIYASTGLDDRGLILEDEGSVKFKHGIPARGIALYKALIGDDSDNIKGIAYFSKDVAKKLASYFTTPDQIEASRKQLLSGSYKRHVSRIFEEFDLVRLNFQVTNIDPEYFPEITETSDEDWQGFLTYYEAITTLNEMRVLCDLQ